MSYVRFNVTRIIINLLIYRPIDGVYYVFNTLHFMFWYLVAKGRQLYM